MLYRRGIFKARRIPQTGYPSIGQVAIPRAVQANMYDMATNMVFFVLHVKALVTVGMGNLDRNIHDATRNAKEMPKEMGWANQDGTYGNPDEKRVK